MADTVGQTLAGKRLPTACRSLAVDAADVRFDVLCEGLTRNAFLLSELLDATWEPRVVVCRHRHSGLNAQFDAHAMASLLALLLALGSLIYRHAHAWLRDTHTFPSLVIRRSRSIIDVPGKNKPCRAKQSRQIALRDGVFFVHQRVEQRHPRVRMTDDTRPPNPRRATRSWPICGIEFVVDVSPHSSQEVERFSREQGVALNDGLSRFFVLS